MYFPNPIEGARSAARRCASTTSSIATRRYRNSFAFRLASAKAARASGSSSSSGKKREVLRDDAGEPLVAPEEPAEVLGGGLGDAVDVLRNGRDALVDPGRGLARRGGLSASPKALVVLVMTKLSTPAREASSSRMSVPSTFVSTNSSRPCVATCGLCRVAAWRTAASAGQAARDKRPVGDRPDDVGEGPGNDVEPDGLAPCPAQRAHQRFAEMPRTSGDENGHNVPLLATPSHDRALLPSCRDRRFRAYHDPEGGRNRTKLGPLARGTTISAPVRSPRGALPRRLFAGARDRSGPALPHGAAGADAGRRADRRSKRSGPTRTAGASASPSPPRRPARSPSRMSATCRFREPGRPRAVARSRLADARRRGAVRTRSSIFLVRYWLATPEGRAADPAPLGDLSGALRLPRSVAYGLQMALDGLPLSAIYALLAAAYSLIYGLIGRINFAFGELAAAGGYAAAMAALALAGLPPAPLLAAAFALAAVVACGWGFASARCGLHSAASRQGPAGAGGDRRPRPLPAGAPANRPGRPDELDGPSAQPAFRARAFGRLHRRRDADDVRRDRGRARRSASRSSSSSAGRGRGASGAPIPTIRSPPKCSASAPPR